MSGRFDESGFALAERVLSDDRIAAICAAIDNASESDAVRTRGGRTYAVRNALSVIADAAIIALGSPQLAQVVRDAIGDGAFPVRATIFDKTPEANWHVPWHQDRLIPVNDKHDVAGFGPWSQKAGVWFVQPPAEVLASMVAVRLHLDDCSLDNGPLRVIAGSHRGGFLDTQAIDEWKKKPSTTVAAARGSALLFRPLLLHASSPATEPSHRRVLHVEFARSPLPPPLEWIDPTRIEATA